MEGETQREPANELGTVYALSIGLAMVLVAAKFVLLPFPVETLGEFFRWLLRLAIIVAADLFFVAALAGVMGTLSLLTARHRSLSRVWRIVLIGTYQLAALYGIATVPMYRLTMVPLTVQLLSFAGGPKLMGSSIGAFLSGGTLLAAVTVPALLVLVAIHAQRKYMLAGLRGMAWLGLMLLVSGVFAGACQAYIQHEWTDPNRWERRIAASTHTVFLSSCVDEMWKSDRLGLSYEPAEVDESDFLPAAAAERPLPRPAQAKNLIVLVLESAGAKHLSVCGARHKTTPNLARLVEQGGLVFENVYAHAPSSPKGLVALTSSVYPRIDWKLITRDSPAFAVPTLPQVLDSAGYRTCYLHSGWWSWKERHRFLRERGVDALIDADSLHDAPVFSWGMSDRSRLEAGLAWIDEAPGEPFHLFAWTIETHHPYIAGDYEGHFPHEDEEYSRYLAALRGADELIGWLHAELQRRGLADSTLIAITGDHGEAFGEHRQRVHSFGIYQENVRVPLVLLHPSLKSANAQRDDILQQIDIAPTLLGLLGQVPPPDWQGRDVLTAGPRERAYFYSTGNEVLLGLREGRYKYHLNITSGDEELFDLQADPNELTNIAAEDTDRCAKYRRRVSGLVTYQRRFLSQRGSR